MTPRLLVVAALFSLTFAGCSKNDGQSSDGNQHRAAEVLEAAETRVKSAAEELAPSLPTLDVAGLQAGLNDGTMQAVDVNSTGTRAEFGVIPGAILLSGQQFDLQELPADQSRHLVFYCSSPACTAAPRAALRASEHGYKHTSILVPGIRGWVNAGADVESTD